MSTAHHVLRRADDGTWAPAVPLGYQGQGLDFEVSGRCWNAYHGPSLVASGRARTRAGRAIGMWLAACRHRKTNR